MNFRTRVEISPADFRISYASRILSLGSCFSVHIATQLAKSKYSIMQNPFGITFNPESILSCIKSCLAGNSLPEEEMINSGSLWAHYDFHGSFNHPDKQMALQSMNAAIKETHHWIQTTDRVIITLGTAFVYLYNNKVVNNCHKQDQSLFDRQLLSISKISDILEEITGRISAASSKEVKYIFTVSPVRHLKDGLVQNQLSKARLIQAIHEICLGKDNCFYFPAYEILMDELRDYRFYAEDMIHPSPVAIEYIYRKFEELYLDPAEQALRDKTSKISKALEHRPLHPGSSAHRVFRENLLSQMDSLEKEFPFINYKKEKEKIKRSG